MKDFGLPRATIEFLKSGQQLAYNPAKCEAGLVKLKRFEELAVSTITISSERSMFKAEDPHADEWGYYFVHSVDLVDECRAYGAEGILIWLPDYRVFGQWDCDHHDVVTFPRASWADVMKAPARFLGAQWDYKADFIEHLKPWDKCEFKAGPLS